MSALYADTVLAATAWTKVYPPAGSTVRPTLGVLLRVPANYAGAANTKTAVWSKTSGGAPAAGVVGVDVSFGDNGQVNDTLIRAEAIQESLDEIWVKGSLASTPVAVVAQ